MNFSFATLQASQATTALVGRVNLQIQQSAAIDEQPQADQAPNQRGEVLVDQPDSFVSLSYDPQTTAPKNFAFKAHQNLMAEDGTLVVPSGTESGYLNSEGKETFRLQVPTDQGMATQKAVLDNQASKVIYSEGDAPAQEFSYESLQGAQATAALVQKLQVQIQQTAGVDEQSGMDQALGLPGKVSLRDAVSEVDLQVDAATSLPQSFNFKATQNITTPEGQVLVMAGSESAYARDGQVETFRQDTPTDQGMVRQQAVLNNQDQTVDYQEFILTA